MSLPAHAPPSLAAEQRAVVEAAAGAALVIAGAGSGKTRALTHRVARLVARGTPPERILLATFTNRAAREMVARVEQLTGCDGRAMWAGTFHHVANRVLRRHGHRVGLSRYGLLDRDDARELLGRCLDEEGGRRLPAPSLAQRVLSLAAGGGLTLAGALGQHAPRCDPQPLERVAARYQRRKAEMALLDFDDLLVLWKLLIVDDAEVRRELEDGFEHVLVDEYQDASPLQAELMERSSAAHGNLMVVGDDAQSIYRFRGADVSLLLDFPRRFPDAAIYRLETNYRSLPPILALANRSIAHNLHRHPKVLRPAREGGELPSLHALPDVERQAERAAEMVLEQERAGRPLGEIAVLYRNHAHGLELQAALLARRVPHRVRSGPRLTEQAHVKDVLAFLRVASNPLDELAWSRLLKLWPGLGRTGALKLLERIRASGRSALVEAGALSGAGRAVVRKIGELFEELDEAGPRPSPLLRTVVEHHYRAQAARLFDDAPARLDELERLAAWAERYQRVEELLTDLALIGSGDSDGARLPSGEEVEPLTLSTVHQAKGLEWPVVILIGLSDGQFPQAVTLRASPEEEEERRLFHVAVTRARDELHLLYPERAVQREGVRTVLLPSRFLSELSGEPSVLARGT